MDSHLTSDRVDMGDNETNTKFIVNGREYSLKIDNRYTLLDILRDHLRLTGAKKGIIISLNSLST